MQRKLFTNQNAVRIAVIEDGSGNPRGASPLPAGSKPASARIRQVSALVGDLLLDDDLELDKGLLMGTVAERLDSLRLELEELAGQQHMFELFMNDAP
jgi:hypothetical protein